MSPQLMSTQRRNPSKHNVNKVDDLNLDLIRDFDRGKFKTPQHSSRRIKITTINSMPVER